MDIRSEITSLLKMNHPSFPIGQFLEIGSKYGEFECALCKLIGELSIEQKMEFVFNVNWSEGNEWVKWYMIFKATRHSNAMSTEEVNKVLINLCDSIHGEVGGYTERPKE